MKLCSIKGCPNAHRARGLCATHYNQEHQQDRHKKYEVPCAQCGTPLLKVKAGQRRSFCDYTCRDIYSIEHNLGAWSREPKPKSAKTPMQDMRSPLRKALEDGDRQGVIAAIKADCEVRPSGCWEWQRRLSDSGYAEIRVAGKTMQGHRLTLEARLGKPLGKQAAHHICANSFCVNPDHLQPVTARENTAEMLARTYMESRIRDLEAALSSFDPEHPLLCEVGISPAA